MTKPTQKEKDDLARVINQVDMITEMLRNIRESLPEKTKSNYYYYNEAIRDVGSSIDAAINEIAGIGNIPRRFGWVPKKGKW